MWREEVAGKQDMRGGRKGVERRGSGKTGYEGGKKGCGEKRWRENRIESEMRARRTKRNKIRKDKNRRNNNIRRQRVRVLFLIIILG